MKRVAIILSGGTGSRLWPLTSSISKQLLPVYDKPMVFYPLSTLMLAGIREYVVITNSENVDQYKKILGDGSHLGIDINIIGQRKPNGIPQAFILAEEYIKNKKSLLMLGDNLFFGEGFPKFLKKIDQKDEAVIFGYQVEDPRAYGVISMDRHGKVIDIEEKPVYPKSNFAVPGLYFYPPGVSDIARNLKLSERGETEITDLNKYYIEHGKLFVKEIGRGVAWLDMGTPKALLEASDFISAVQNRQGLLIGSPEEAAFRAGFITKENFSVLVENIPDGDYKKALLKCIDIEDKG